MFNKAKILRPRPGPWGQGRDRGQGFEVKAEANFLRTRPRLQAEAKNKVMNKKYQMMIDSIQVNLNHYDPNDTV